MRVSGRARVTERRETAPEIVELRLEPPPGFTISPGGFVELAAGGDTLLRRPISAAGFRDGLLRLIVRVVGAGTANLAELRPGDDVDLLGPLGAERTIDVTGRRLILVGGGVGLAPLLFFADDYAGRAATVELLLGAATGEETRGYLALVPGGLTARAASDDGGEGLCGPVTDLLAGLLNEDRGNEDIVVACGPPAMLDCVRRLTATAVERGRSVETWVLLEALMACGTGLCRGCAVPATEGGYRMVCQDGPLFRADELAWPLPEQPRPTRLVLEGSAPAPEESLRTRLGTLELATPLITASGTSGYGPELAEAGGLEGVGALVTKTVTREPRAGNPPPRLWETPAGMLNSIGLANVGLERFLAEELPRALELGVPIIVNLGGSTIEDYVETARALGRLEGPAALELNVSCPNVGRGGIQFGTDPGVVDELVSRVREVVPERPLFVKLTPNVTDITVPARAAAAAGADGLTAANTLLGLAVDPLTSRPVLGNVLGGLSGPAIRPVAVRLVHQLRSALPDTPIIGLGGVEDWRGAAEHLIAGADAVGLGSVNLYRPGAAARIARDLRRLVSLRGVKRLDELVSGLILDRGE